jgi:hypothetical protein
MNPGPHSGENPGLNPARKVVSTVGLWLPDIVLKWVHTDIKILYNV